MNIKDAVQEMSELRPATEAAVRQMLDENYHVIFADKNNFDDNMLKYDLFVEDNILYCCKLSDSTRDNIVLTPEDAAIYTTEWFHILWESYLSGKDRVFVDTVGHMHSADIRMGQFSHEAIKAQLKGKTVFHFNDPYAPAEDLDLPKVSIYVIDIGIPVITDVLADTIAAVPGATMVSSPKKADFSILPMPPGLPVDTDRLFQGCVSDAQEIRKIKKQLAPILDRKTAKGILPYTLIFYTNAAGKLVAKNKAEAQLKAADDLSAAVAEFIEKTKK